MKRFRNLLLLLLCGVIYFTFATGSTSIDLDDNETNNLNNTNNDTEVFDYLHDRDSIDFINSYNKKYPNEQITKDQIIEDDYLFTIIKINDSISFKISESDGEVTYNCYGNMKYSKEHKEKFFLYVERLINACNYNIQYNEFSNKFPTEERYSNDKINVSYTAREGGTEKYPTFEVFIYYASWQ